MKKLFILSAILLGLAGCANITSRINSARPEIASLPPDRQALEYFTRGSYLVESGDLPGAEQALKKALELDPGADYIHLKLAEIYFNENRPDDARDEARIVYKKNPQNTRVLTLLGRIEASTSNYSAARKYLVAANKLDPDDDDIEMLLWRVNASLRRYSDAIGVLDNLAARYPEVPEIQFFKALVYEAWGKHSEAMKNIKTALELNPNMIPALIFLGDIEKSNGNNAEAEKYWRRVLDLEPGNIEARQRLSALNKGEVKKGEQPEPGSPEELGLRVGVGLLEQERYDDAIKEFKKLLADRPGNTVIALYLGLAYEGARKLDDALAIYRTIPAESSLYGDAQLREAIVLEQKGKLQEALSIADALVDAFPDRVDMVIFLAHMYIRTDQPKQAAAILEPLVKKKPDDMQLLFLMGVAYGESGDKEKAIKVMRRILEQNPKNAEALNYIGYSLVEDGVRLDEAELLILKALELKPDNAAIIDSLGWLYFQKGQYQNAITELELANSLEPKEPVISEHLADAYLKAGRKNDAIKLYKQALEGNPTASQMKRIQGKLKKLGQ